MLSRLQPNDIDKIRTIYSDNVLYKAIKEACLSCCEIPKVYPLCQEQVFVEVVSLLDELKQEQQDVHWENLFRNIRQDYHLQNTTVPDKELDCITITIIYALASILAVSYISLYHRLAEKLMLQCISHKSAVSPEALDSLMDGIEKYDNEIAEWLRNYMDTNEFLSDKITAYIMPPQTIEGKYISFTKSATIDQQAVFTATLHTIISGGKKKGLAADIRFHLKSAFNDGIIELVGSDKDIYNELVTNWGYSQGYNTFMEAEPKLPRKRY